MKSANAPLVVSAVAAALAAAIPATAHAQDSPSRTLASIAAEREIAQRPETRTPARRTNIPSDVRIVRGNLDAVSRAARRQIEAIAARIDDMDEGRSADGSTWTQINCINSTCEKIVTWTETSETGRDVQVTLAQDTSR